MTALILITCGILLRLLPHAPNFAPITAIALFGSTYLNKKLAFILPLITIAISDYLLFSTSMFHSTTPFVWGSFILSGLIGLWLRKRKKPIFIIGASLVASLQFFLITNFGVWATGMYDRSFYGLIQSYIMGIPFYRWTLLGDLFYTLSFFTLYKIILLIIKRFKVINDNLQSSYRS